MTNQTKHQSLETFAERTGHVVYNLNDLISRVVNDEVTAADFHGDLSQLFAKLDEVEGVIKQLEDVFWKTAESPEEETA